MILVLYIFAIFISLFILYAVARHDFVLLRQSISLRQVFDAVFISLAVFFIISRIAYSFYIQSIDLLNPLKFFYLTKHWGILPYAGVFGLMVALIYLYRKKKNKLRILDIYFISISPVILLDVLLNSNNGIILIIKIVAAAVLSFFYIWFIRIHNKFSIKDGFITFMIILTYSLTTLALSLASYGVFSQKFIWFNSLLVGAILMSIIFLVLIQMDKFNRQ